MKAARSSGPVSRRGVSLLVCLCFRIGPIGCGADAAKPEPDAQFFDEAKVRVFELKVPEAALTQLAQSPRDYVAGEVTEGEQVLPEVGIRLKGMSSFRSLDEKPSFAVKFDEFQEGQTYRGFKKLMFNNSAQDPTYLAELLGTQLFRRAGVPAARVTHARVQLNGRDLGLYVVIEAMNKDFLKQQFGSGKGNLYEGFLQDVHGRLEQDNGADESQTDLRALHEACIVSDPAERWEQLNYILDVDRFLSFVAMELLTSHWDGYAIHFNNYRLYHDPGTDKMVFITHGLDALFRRPEVSIDPPLKSLVVRAVLTTADGRKLYEERIRELSVDVFKVPVIIGWLDEALAKLRAGGLEKNHLAAIERHAGVMRERIKVRGQRVEEQLRGIKPETIKFDKAGFGFPVSWREEPDRGDAILDRVRLEGRDTLHIEARQERTRASWRAQVFLAPGWYRFEGMVRTKLANRGSARLRVSGDNRTMAITGDGGWRLLTHDFPVRGAGMDEELICELNAPGGDVWFDVASLRVKAITAEQVRPIHRRPLGDE